MTCSVWCGTIEIRYTNYNRLSAALEIWTYRCTEYSEHIFSGRFYTDNRVNTKHIRTNIKRCTRTKWWHIISVCLNNLHNCLNPLVLRINRHLKSAACVCHSLRIQIRTECNNMSILCRVRL